ncbi:WecB/TagA/CpsF family glycosyltransferase [Methylobacterium oryzae CBMB20]
MRPIRSPPGSGRRVCRRGRWRARCPPSASTPIRTTAAALAERIRAHGTTLLVLGVGAPKSEIWVDRQGPALGNPVVLCVGDALNVAAGCLPRARD